MGNFQIETTQNININQSIASLGNRIGATLLDFTIIYIYIMAILMFSGVFNSVNPDVESFGMIITIASIPILFYDLLFEYYMNGQTPGKKMLKIQVVKTDGSSAGFIAYFLRWLLRLIEVQMSFGIIAIITYLINGKGQRIGDIIAGTTVVKLSSTYISNNVFINIPEDYVPSFPHVTLFSDEDITRIKELYIKARRNNDGMLLARLRDRIKDKLNIDTEMDDLDFVKTIVKDYYYFYYNESDASLME